MTRWFKGIDFANREQNIGVCCLEVTNRTLTVHFDTDVSEVEATGIDCPFGTSLGFWRLLQGQDPGYDSKDDFQTRHTDRWLREHLWNYHSNTYWRENVAENPQHYVNKTAHVQPTVRLQIVPGFLDSFRKEVGNGQLAIAIKAARRGENAYVEAHPRAFLYSAIERIWRSPASLTEPEKALRAVAQYKDVPKVSHVDERRATYALLQQHTPAWLGEGYQLPQALEELETLFSTDHAFDAWLSALTAFAHTERLTITWQSAMISEDEVNVEGHILILK